MASIASHTPSEQDWTESVSHYVNRSEETMTRICQLHVHVQELAEGIQARVQAVSRLSALNCRRHEEVLRITEEVVYESKTRIEDISRIFQQLSMRKTTSRANEAKGQTLVDFVDVQTVEKLQADASSIHEQLLELVSANEKSVWIIERIRNFYESNACMMREENCTDIAKYDEKDPWKSLRVYFSQFKQQAADALAEQNQLIQNTYQVLETVRALETQIAESCRSLDTFYGEMITLFVDMEQCDRLVMDNIANITVCYDKYEVKYSALRALVEELASLAAFYHRFLEAFEALEPELERRKDRADQMKNLAKEYEVRLSKLSEEEMEKRKEFVDRFANYLPSSLCPDIMEMPAQYTLSAVMSDSESFENVGGVETLKNIK